MIKSLFFLTLILTSCTTVYRLNCYLEIYPRWANIKKDISFPDSLLNNPGDTIELTDKTFTKEKLLAIKGSRIKGELYDSLFVFILAIDGGSAIFRNDDKYSMIKNKSYVSSYKNKYSLFYLGETVLSNKFRSFLIMLSDENYIKKNNCKDFSRRILLINVINEKSVSYIELSNYSLINGNVNSFYTDFTCDTINSLHCLISSDKMNLNSSGHKHIVIDSITHATRIIFKEDGLIEITLQTAEWDYDENEEYVID